MQPVLLRYPLVMVQPRWSVEQGRLRPTRLWPALTPGLALRLVLAALAIVLILWLFVACAAGRPTSLIRLPEGYEVLTAHCETSSELCQRIQVTGDPADEEAWGFRARPAATALFKEPEVFYAVGDRARCDQVRAALSTPTEACCGPVYFRRE
jgi:hypothetical protein